MLGALATDFSELELDFDLAHLPDILAWLSSQVATRPTTADPTVPSWIQDTDAYRDGLFEFQPSSEAFVFCGAFYLGETFVRRVGGLRWSLGTEGFASAGNPVVEGFHFGQELDVVNTMTNLVKRAIIDKSSSSAFHVAVEYWRDQTP